jgi:2-hydroxycyclohexanecarboxyl-CoA dehydrogenase
MDCTRAVLPGMIEQRSGRIINVGSTAGITGDPWMTPYSAAKGGVHAFTKVLAKEVGQFGITVNCVSPRGTFPENLEEETSAGSRWNPKNPIMTPDRIQRFTELETSSGRDPSRDKTVVGKAMGRPFLRPYEVGAATVFLAADSSGFITGQVLVLDGGLTLAA